MADTSAIERVAWRKPEYQRLTVDEVVDLADVKVAFATSCSSSGVFCPDLRPPD